MKCPNPACGNETFKVMVAWKQRIKELPQFLPVYLKCAKCGREIHAYVLNENLDRLIEQMNGLHAVVGTMVKLLEHIAVSGVPKKRFQFFRRR